MNKLKPTRTALLIVFLVVFWGVSWPFSKIALSYTPPMLFSGMRALLGGIFLLFVAVPRYKSIRLRESWLIYLISTVFNIGIYYALMTIGLNYLPSGLFSVLVFLQPVLIGIFSWLWLGESMTKIKIIGLTVGFAGVAVISAGSLSGHMSFMGIGMALGSALSWAVGTVYVKKKGNGVDPVWLVTLQLVIGGLSMTGLGLTMERWSSIRWSLTFVLCLLFISIFVIAIGWLVFFALIGSGEATKVASYTFLIPLIATATGILFLHEPLTVYLLVGLILIVFSIYLVNRKQSTA
jgi:drug/metabolite transporter (DMT)-like permease